MQEPINRRVEQGRSTRQQIIEVATRLFAERGFDGTSIDSVLTESGLSRGALYHHFANKEALFEAVLQVVERGVMDRLVEAVASFADPVEALQAGCRAWLQLAREPTVRRITLVDAPAVVGWQRWRQIDAEYGFGLLKGALSALADAGRLSPQIVEPMAHLLLASLMEAALLTSQLEDGDPAIAATEEALGSMLERLLGSPTPSA